MRRDRLVSLAIWILGLQAALVGVASAQTNDDEKKTPAVDPAGTWRWDYTINDNAAEFKLKLKWDDEKLTGQYTAFENTTDIEDVKLEKDLLSFATSREFDGNKFRVHFNGKVQPDEITGTVSIDRDGNGLREFDWNAKRVVEIDDVLGSWELRVETPNGAVEPQLTITAEGDELRGKSVSDTFGELEAKNVKLKDNTLMWDVSVVNNGIEFNIKYAGKPRGNTIEGSNEFSVGENTGTMKFTGKRTPPEKKEKEQPAAEPESEGSGDQ